MELLLLGPVQARIAGQPVALGMRKQRLVLAVLAMEAGRHVSVEQLIRMLWPTDPPVSARGMIHSSVSGLRTIFAQWGATGNSIRLERGTLGYELHCDPQVIDVHRFRALVANTRCSEDDQRRVELLKQALALWRGPALAGTATCEEIREQLCRRLEEARLTAHEDLIDSQLRLGLHGDLVDELFALVNEHPYRPRLISALMLMLHRTGRSAEALNIFQCHRRRLSDEHGLDPPTHLQEMQVAILRDDPDLSVATPIAKPFSAYVQPRQLPADVSAFTGRSIYLEDLDTSLAEEPKGVGQAVVISAIEGIAGVGKTALALHWAHRVACRWPEGQLYVNLRGYAPSSPMDPAEALERFLQALGVPQEQIPLETDERASLYRSLLADKRALVVLDNAANAEQVRPLLPGSTTCLVLITSRSDLRGLVALNGAHRLVLDVLTAEEAACLLSRTIGDDRTGNEPEAGAELARLCGHLPLALRIAAAHLASDPRQTIAEYLERLTVQDRLACLAIPADQQTAVRASFDLSYQRLNSEAARLFRLLGLIPGQDFTPNAAAALADSSVERATELLEELAAAHLIEHPVSRRFQFHDLLRLYAAERARDEESRQDRDDALQRLFVWYLHSTRNAARLFTLRLESLNNEPAAPGVQPRTFTDNVEALEWLDMEQANLVATVQHAARYGPRPMAWHLAYMLKSYFYFRMSGADWLKTAQAGLQAADLSNDLGGQAAMLHSYANAHFRLENYEKALEYNTQALPLSKKADDRRVEAEILYWCGFSSWLLGRLDESADYHTQALELCRQADDRHGESFASIGLAMVYHDMGQCDRILHHANQALELGRRVESRYAEALALNCRGMAYSRLGNFAEARDQHTTALTLFRQIGTQYHEFEAASLYRLALIHRDTGGYELALADATQSLALSRQGGNRMVEASVLNALGTINELLEHFDKAIDHHQPALELAKKTGFRRAETEALTGLAAAHLGLDRHKEAITFSHLALHTARQSGFRPCQGTALTTLADIHLALNQYEHAAEHAHQALAVHSDINHPVGQARALRLLGHALHGDDGIQSAIPYWKRALAIVTDLGTPEANQLRTLIKEYHSGNLTPC